MPSSPSARRQAAISLAKKLQLEARFKPEVTKILRRVVGNFKVTYPEKLDTVMPHAYTADMTAALRTHYNRVMKSFIGHVSRGSKALSIERKDLLSDKVRANLSAYFLQISKDRADLIMKTTSRELEQKIQFYVQQASDEGRTLTSNQIAKLASDDYLSRIPGRADVISLTETQMAAESTKTQELETILEEGGFGASDDEGGLDTSEDDAVVPMREWVAILDERTRDWHAEADGQRVAIGEPFNVGGEDLMEPGDPAGSPENIINCRCSAEPVF